MLFSKLFEALDDGDVLVKTQIGISPYFLAYTNKCATAISAREIVKP